MKDEVFPNMVLKYVGSS